MVPIVLKIFVLAVKLSLTMGQSGITQRSMKGNAKFCMREGIKGHAPVPAGSHTTGNKVCREGPGSLGGHQADHEPEIYPSDKGS